MNVRHLIKDRNKVIDQFYEKDNQLWTKNGCSIYIPANYPDIELASIGEDISIVGLHGIVINDTHYCINTACALMSISPTTTTTVTIEDTEYLEFKFAANTVVYTNLNLVKIGTLVFRIYDSFIAMGKIPWYHDRDSMCFLFNTALLHGGANLKMNSAILELLIAQISRNPNDLAEFYRHYENREETVEPPVYISLKNVAYGATNTTAKLGGNMLNEGITSALVTSSNTNEEIEDLLRG